MEAAGRDEGQGAAPGLEAGQWTGVRLTTGAPSSAPLPHQGLGWGVLGAPGLLELWREREGGERRLLGAQRRKEVRPEGGEDRGEGVKLRGGLQNQEGSEWGGGGRPDLQKGQGAASPRADLQWGRNRKQPAASWGEQIFAKGVDAG